MQIRKIGITGRSQNRLARKTAAKAVALLIKRGILPEIDSSFIKIKALEGKKLAKFRSGLILSFGGDGTLLKTYRELRSKTPVMGINCGNLGFLQSFSSKEVEDAVDFVLSEKISIEKRTRILAKVDGKIIGEALNEILIVPAKAGRLLKYKLRIGKDERNEAGDGLIIATPTGSTAHSLSAGGPIVKGNAAVFVVVSLNPVDWKHRPLIINDHEKVIVTHFENASRQEVIIDGQKRVKVKNKIEITRGKNVLFVVPVK